jgi:glycosyltransferase involved in cell wall biosynthesis
MQVTLLPGNARPWDGIEVYSFELAKRLSSKGIHTVGLRISSKDDIFRYNKNFEVIYVKTSELHGGIGYNLRALEMAIKKFRVLRDSDIIHAIGGYYSAVELFPHNRKVVTIIGASSLRERSSFKKNLRRLYASMIYRFASLYIVPNDIIKEEVKKYYRINPIVIPLGIDINGLKINENINQIKIKYGLKESDKVVLYLGQLVNGKRLFELIKSFKIASEKSTDLKLLLVAWGYLKDQLKNLARELKIEDKVVFMNPVEYETRKYIYNIADVFIMLGDSFGDGGISSAVMDALGTGLPIIVSKNSSNVIVVKDGYNGFTVDPQKYDKVASAIPTAIENRELFGKNSLTIAKKFDWDIIADEIIKNYNNLL